jgi:hypothetical protein
MVPEQSSALDGEFCSICQCLNWFEFYIFLCEWWVFVFLFICRLNELADPNEGEGILYVAYYLMGLVLYLANV